MLSSPSGSSESEASEPLQHPEPATFLVLRLRPRSFYFDRLLEYSQESPNLYTYILEGNLRGVLLSRSDGARLLLFLPQGSWASLVAVARWPHTCLSLHLTLTS